MIAEIHRYELTQYSEHGEPLTGDIRCLRRLPRRTYSPDAKAIAEHGSAAAAVTAYLRTLKQGFVLASAAPGPNPGVLSHAPSLVAYRRLPSRTAIHTRVYLHECSDTERDAVFEAVTA